MQHEKAGRQKVIQSAEESGPKKVNWQCLKYSLTLSKRLGPVNQVVSATELTPEADKNTRSVQFLAAPQPYSPSASVGQADDQALVLEESGTPDLNAWGQEVDPE